MVVGHGAFPMHENIAALTETLGTPVLTTFKAKGLLPDDHRRAGGVLGPSGTPIASWFMTGADLIIALGTSLSNRTGIEPSKQIIEVDDERMQFGKFHPVAYRSGGMPARFAT